jgi:hypothetical protein
MSDRSEVCTPHVQEERNSLKQTINTQPLYARIQSKIAFVEVEGYLQNESLLLVSVVIHRVDAKHCLIQ